MEVFDCRLPIHFILCMWPAGRRKALTRQAAGHDAVLVLGCDCALKIAGHSLKGSSCKIIPAMEAEGVMNVVLSIGWPFKISLRVTSVTQVKQTPAGWHLFSRPWGGFGALPAALLRHSCGQALWRR